MGSHDALASVLTRADGRWPMPVAARELARMGVPVFPCVPGGKRPLTEHGFHDATTGADRVDAWWRQHPEANIGVPTGAPAGVVVVDVDVHGPVDGFAAFERAHRAGLVEGWQFLVTTPSGGMHAYYPAAPGEPQRSWQAARAGVDFRGNGGYILVPPSVVSVNGAGVGYRVRQVNPGPSSMLDSNGLRGFLDPRPTPRRPVGPGVAPGRDVSRLAAWVATRSDGERNRGLFWAACRLAENNVPASDALDVLSAAAADAGLGEREITATVRSAYRTAQPRTRGLSSPPAQDSSPVAAYEWLAKDTATRSAPQVRRL